jgi:hypothetical protein
VVSGVGAADLERAKAAGDVTRITALGSHRFALEVPLTADPARVMAGFGAQGAQLVSLTPIRETLEDFFVRQIALAPADRGLEPVAR